jgi:NADH-quinone oxidoreductase subunit L
MLFVFDYAWLVPLLPLIGFTLITLTPLGRSRRASAWVATLLMCGATLVALLVLAATAQQAGAAEPLGGAGYRYSQPLALRTFRWAPAGDGAISMGYLVDPPVAIMLAMVAVAATAIHLFSIGYMAEDERQARFFAFISLFSASMLTMVMASNLILLFIAWELMGLCSYLLIGFWYDRDYRDPYQITPRQAAIKAFITTRIGDVLLMVGLCYLWTQAGTLEIGTAPGQIFEPGFLQRSAGTPGFLGLSIASGIALLLFCGTIGKSAQVPLQVWLPDAMEGPTPVSALIHAATMVAAGVFLVARTYPIFLASAILPLVAAVGAFTALFAALAAVAQFDIKRILAYSTISQLGFMVVALGIGGWAAALFHLLTHAFFKALLFLGAGSVIHGMERTVGHDPNRAQDIRNMGGLRRFMPITFWTYLAGYLALAGLAPFAGFWSKDEILAESMAGGHTLVLAALLVASFLTAFYMTRQVLLVFFGPFRSAALVHAAAASGQRGHTSREPHESPAVMTAPLVLLALFAVFAGALNLPGSHWLTSFLGQESRPFSTTTAALATAVTLAGMIFAAALYRRAYQSPADEDPLAGALGPAFGLLRRGFDVDRLYALTIGRAVKLLQIVAGLLDSVIAALLAAVDRLTALLGKLSYVLDDTALNDGGDQVVRATQTSGQKMRRLADGRVQDYVTLALTGMVVLAAFFIYMTVR